MQSSKRQSNNLNKETREKQTAKLMREPIQQFLEQYSKPKTKMTYKTALRPFIDAMYGDVRQGHKVTPAEDAKYEELAGRYLSEKHEIAQDLTTFIAKKLAQKPPKSGRLFIAAVREI